MKVKWIKANKGCNFALTELGLELPRIRAKYTGDTRKQYETAVPASWIENGYVHEVRVDDVEEES